MNKVKVGLILCLVIASACKPAAEAPASPVMVTQEKISTDLAKTNATTPETKASTPEISAPELAVGPAPEPLPVPVLPPRASPADFPLVVNTVIEKQYYLPGQPVQITVSITNVGPEIVTFKQFPPEITATADENNRVIHIADAGNESFELKPKDRAVYKLAWDQRNDMGAEVPTGWYLITVANVYFTRENGRSTLANWGDQRIDIQPSYPQGTLIKDLDPNLSQIKNGNNVTLRHVSLTENGSAFSFFCIPANYNYGGQVSNAAATAEYTVNGTTRSAGFAGYGDDTSRGIRLEWGQNNPLQIVPKDAEEIIFSITSIVISTYDRKSIDLGGPWEFKIPLQ